MKTIIAGSREITDEGVVAKAVAASGYHITEVVSGGAGGVDSLGEEYAFENGIALERFPVHDFEWEKSLGAGHRRNKVMVDYADALIAIWDGKSDGTRNVIKQAKAKGIPVFVYMVSGD